MFDLQKPTTQMLGRWQPWHDDSISATQIRAKLRDEGKL